LTKHNQRASKRGENERDKEGLEGENERWNGKNTEGKKKDKVTRTEKRNIKRYCGNV